MAPLASEQQRKWGNSPSGRKKLGKEKVKEYNEKSKGKTLPKKKK